MITLGKLHIYINFSRRIGVELSWEPGYGFVIQLANLYVVFEWWGNE